MHRAAVKNEQTPLTRLTFGADGQADGGEGCMLGSMGHAGQRVYADQGNVVNLANHVKGQNGQVILHHAMHNLHHQRSAHGADVAICSHTVYTVLICLLELNPPQHARGLQRRCCYHSPQLADCCVATWATAMAVLQG